MNFGKVGPGAKVTGQIYVCNIGDPWSYLEWYIDIANVPAWGNWTFSSSAGNDVKKDDCVIVNVTCILKNLTGSYNGTIVVYNADDSTDFCEIDTSVEISRVRSQNNLIWNLFKQFPFFDRIIYYLKQ
jgi:hypothetical protein